MKPISNVEGRALPLGLDNVDTDLIIPAEFLKITSREGLGKHAFAALRREPGNMVDDPAYAGVSILVSGENFGCGSSREHAVWALLDLGIRAVIASSFSDIFLGNAFKNGLVAARVDRAHVPRLLDQAASAEFRVDLPSMSIILLGFEVPFQMDGFQRECLLHGLAEIDLTLGHEVAIARHEANSRRLGWAVPVLPKQADV